MRYRSEDKLSQPKTLDMGVPQGSVIAPTLFIFFLHDIADLVTLTNAKLKLFADDISLISSTFVKRGEEKHIKKISNQY